MLMAKLFLETKEEKQDEKKEKGKEKIKRKKEKVRRAEKCRDIVNVI